MATKKKLDLLTAVEHIVEKAKGSGLNSEFFRKSRRYIKYISDKLDFTADQSVIMALFIDYSNKSKIHISEFRNYLNCSLTRILQHMTDIDVLEQKEYIRCCREECEVSYAVPFDVIEAFKKDEKYIPKDCSGLTFLGLFNEISKLFRLRANRQLLYAALVQKIEYLLSQNMHLTFVQKIHSFGIQAESKMLLILFAHLFVNNYDDDIRYHDLDFLFEDSDWYRVKNELNHGNHILMREKIVEYNCSDGFVDRTSFRMSIEAKRDLFPELNITFTKQEQHRKGMIKHEEIVEKQLFFGEKENRQILELVKILEEENYQNILTRMKEYGLRCGLTCLFYGAPGTGKTETVLQLARMTGRDILQVNISQIKSMWVGESEKNIKQVFENYRMKVRQSEITPILLFNEADAIIGIRKKEAEWAVDKMENSIQNIILEEMERLDGILIATTNMAENMDKAFERRFLYKIKFERPSIESRKRIWMEMMSNLNEETARLLAEKYNFSGGQIENIARHYTIGTILHGECQSIVDRLIEYCDNERIETKEKIVVGFK